MYVFCLAGLCALTLQEPDANELIRRHTQTLAGIKSIHFKLEFWAASQKMSSQEVWRSGVRERIITRDFGENDVKENVSIQSFSDQEVRRLTGWDPQSPYALPLSFWRNGTEFSRVHGMIDALDPKSGIPQEWSKMLFDPFMGISMAKLAEIAEVIVVPSGEDGVLCLEVKASKNPQLAGMKIDLDAKHGYLIRRITQRDGSTRQFEKFAEFPGGVWVPELIRHKHPKFALDTSSKVVECQVNTPLEDAELTVHFPEGSRVHEKPKELIHLWGKDKPFKTFTSETDLIKYLNETARAEQKELARQQRLAQKEKNTLKEQSKSSSPLSVADLPDEFYHDFRGRTMPAQLTWFNIKDKSLVKEEPEGLHIIIPKTVIHPWGGVGLRTAFGFKGDFEVTTTIAMLRTEAPNPGEFNGVGSGVTLYVAKVGGGGASVSRMAVPDGDKKDVPVIAWEWNKNVNGANSVLDFEDCQDMVGRLRLTRVGSTLAFQWAPGIEGDKFQTMYECEFGNTEIERIRLVALNGRTPRLVDVRLFDLRIRGNLDRAANATKNVNGKKQTASDMPLGQTSAGDPAVPTSRALGDPVSSQEPKSHGGLALTTLISLLLVVFAGGGIWLINRRRRGRKTLTTEPIPQASGPNLKPIATLVTFACAGCAKKLKGKAELAGKKIKCPQCGKSVLVPAMNS